MGMQQPAYSIQDLSKQFRCRVLLYGKLWPGLGKVCPWGETQRCMWTIPHMYQAVISDDIHWRLLPENVCQSLHTDIIWLMTDVGLWMPLSQAHPIIVARANSFLTRMPQATDSMWLRWPGRCRGPELGYTSAVRSRTNLQGQQLTFKETIQECAILT